MEIKVREVAGYGHLGLADDGSVVIKSSPRMRVMDIASVYSCEYTPDDIREEFPFLSLAEIHQAIAYFLEHREEIDPRCPPLYPDPEPSASTYLMRRSWSTARMYWSSSGVRFPRVFSSSIPMTSMV